VTIAALVAACLLVPACTTAPATGQPEGNPGSTQLNQRERQELNRKLETYVAGFCGAVVQFAQPVRGFVADTGSPDKLVSSLRSFLDKMTAASATAASELAQLDPSVVPDADRPIEQFRQGLKSTDLLLARLRTKTDEIDPNDQAALRTFLTGFSVEIKNISTGGASVDSLSVNPELRAAADKTPVCLEAQGVGPSGDVDASAVPTS
jgi:hypothetical protein